EARRSILADLICPMTDGQRRLRLSAWRLFQYTSSRIRPSTPKNSASTNVASGSPTRNANTVRSKSIGIVQSRYGALGIASSAVSAVCPCTENQPCSSQQASVERRGGLKSRLKTKMPPSQGQFWRAYWNAPTRLSAWVWSLTGKPAKMGDHGALPQAEPELRIQPASVGQMRLLVP